MVRSQKDRKDRSNSRQGRLTGKGLAVQSKR